MTRERLAKALFVPAVLALVWLYGVVAQMRGLLPQPQLMSLYTLARQAVLQVLEETGRRRAWWYTEIDDPSWRVKLHRPGAMSPGCLLVSGIREDNELMVKIVDNRGETVHEWDIDWFSLWPDPKHLPASVIPKCRPGSHIHGIVMLDNGDLMFNFERLGLICIDWCGEVRWRLPHSTHHSVHAHARGSFWVGGRDYLEKPQRLEQFPNFTEGYSPSCWKCPVTSAS